MARNIARNSRSWSESAATGCGSGFAGGSFVSSRETDGAMSCLSTLPSRRTGRPPTRAGVAPRTSLVGNRALELVGLLADERVFDHEPDIMTTGHKAKRRCWFVPSQGPARIKPWFNRTSSSSRVQRIDVVAAADMASIDENLRDAGAAAGHLDHLGSHSGLAPMSISVNGAPFLSRRLLGGGAIGAPVFRVDRDRGHAREKLLLARGYRVASAFRHDPGEGQNVD